jgi:gamma-glutamylcyclotransferase (GGCT)/AIG2-like uncharacterized protein YtfP
MANKDVNILFGMCDIWINGKKIENRQADKAQFSAEAKYIDIDLYDLPHYDKILESWDVKLNAVFYEEDYETIMRTLPHLEEIKDSVTGETKSLVDGKLWQRVRKDKCVEIRLHPRELPETDKHFDITLFKAFPNTQFNRVFGKEVGKIEVEFVGLARTGDPSQMANYFCIGEVPDVVMPQFVSAETDVTGGELLVKFDESLSSTINTAGFTLKGTLATVVGAALDPADTTNKTVKLTLNPLVAIGDTVTIDIADDTVRDTRGNSNDGVKGQTVTNNHV